MEVQVDSESPSHAGWRIACAVGIVRRLFKYAIFDICSPLVRQVGMALRGRVGRVHKKYRRLWHFASLAYRLYFCGTIGVMVWLVLYGATLGGRWTDLLMYAGAALFFSGFLSWSRPIATNVVSSSIGKWAYRLVHGFFLVFAVAIARNVVAEAVAMPSQYFEVTVSLVALIAYVPVCIAAFAVLMLGVFAGSFMFAFTDHFLLNFLYSWAVPFLGKTKWVNRAIHKLKLRATKAFLHGSGAIVVALVLAATLDGFGFLMRYAAPGIRWFAYMADFQPAGRYPGAPCESRIRLQDNGVIAVAEIVNRDIVFKIKSFKTDADMQSGCISSAALPAGIK